MEAAWVEVSFTETELWLLSDLVRDHGQQGREWDKALMRALQEAVLMAGESPEKKAAIRLTAADCWQITRQIPSLLSVGTQNVGRAILMSVFLALRELEPVAIEAEPDAPGESAVPGAFATAWEQEEAAKATFERLYGDMGGE